MSGSATADCITWVVGAGGLLGSGVAGQVVRTGGALHRELIPWDDPRKSVEALTAGLANVATAAASTGRAWRVAWCAGAGVIGTSPETLRNEVDVFETFLERAAAMSQAPPQSLFLASSAGGLYAGASDPPYTEAHDPHPISPYGDAKLAMEGVASRFAERVGTSVVLGRIANLYGPAQNIAKPQGLVSQICARQLSGQPIGIYVSMDTIRDYIYVDDCGAMVVDALDGIPASQGSSTIKIFASQRGTTVAALLGEFKRVFKRAPRVMLASSPTSKVQARDLRLRSVNWTSLDHRSLTPLPVGILATMQGMHRSAQSSRLP